MFNWYMLLFATLATALAAPDKFVCYYASWAVHRPGNGKFMVDDIDPNICTHLIYSFIGINSNGTIRILDYWHDIVTGGFEKFNHLKRENENLKTLASIGGWNAGSNSFSRVVSDPIRRTKFVDEVIGFLKKYDFDGLDIDWEYPGYRGGSPTDRSNFSKLLAELRRAFNPHHFLLSAAVAATATLVEASYEVPQLSKYLDFINVMTYDFHSSLDGKTGQNTPMYASKIDTTPHEKQRNVDACIRDWIKRGANPNKLVLGISTHGSSFTLANINNRKLGAPIRGGGVPGPYLRKTGVLGYNEQCENLKTGRWEEVWDDQQKVPYAYNRDQWVGYDNTRSVEIKVKYAADMNLGGVMVWSIDTDDFRGTCGPRYPILNVIKRNLVLGIVLRSGFPYPDGFKCTAEGYVRNPKDCTKFYHCQRIRDTFDVSELQCPYGFHFDDKKDACRHPSQDHVYT